MAVDAESGDGFYFRQTGCVLQGTAAALVALGASGLSADHPAVARGIGRLIEDANRWEPLDCETRLAVLGALGTQFASPEGALPPTAFLVDAEDAEETDSWNGERVLGEIARVVHEHLDRFTRTARPKRFGASLCGRALETLAKLGVPPDERIAVQLVARLRQLQKADGSFVDPKGGDPIRVTAGVIFGLRAAGMAPEDPLLVEALRWLRLWADPSGAWRGVENEGRGGDSLEIAPTAAAIAALISSPDETDSELIHHGVEFLLETQDADGTWSRALEGPPDMDATRAALVALSRYAIAAETLPKADTRPTLRIVRSDEEDDAAVPRFTIAK